MGLWLGTGLSEVEGSSCQRHPQDFSGEHLLKQKPRMGCWDNHTCSTYTALGT